MTELQFEIFDVYGRRVICSKGMWFHKLCKYHGLMPEDEKLVKRAINDPDGNKPRLDKDLPETRRVYYRKTEDNNAYVKVVVEYNKQDNGMVIGSVITGYFERSIDAREIPEEK